MSAIKPIDALGWIQPHCASTASEWSASQSISSPEDSRTLQVLCLTSPREAPQLSFYLFKTKARLEAGNGSRIGHIWTMSSGHGGRLERPVDLPSHSSRRSQSRRHSTHRHGKSPRRSDSHDRSRRRHRYRVDHSDRSAARSQSRREASPKPTSHELVKYQDPSAQAAGGDDEVLYVLDNRGDPLIVRYGTNDRSKIPEYRRSGSGKVLGARGYLHISREGARETFVLRGPRDTGSIFRDKHNPLLLQAAQARTKRIRPQASAGQGLEDPVHQDYISLGPSRKRKRDDDEASIYSSDDESRAYRSIQSRKKDEPSDSELEYDSDAALHDRQDQQRDVDPLKERSIELSRIVKEQPGDIESWLELVQLQHELLLDTDRDLTRAEAQSLADIKLSMLETAIKHARSDTDRERVLLRLMREGSKIWDSKSLGRRWREVTQDHSESFGLWKARLDFEVSNLTTFNFESVKQIHLDKLHRLREQLVTTSDTVRTYEQLIYVFLRTTRFIQDAGYSEMAVAAWQALLELTFARPPSMADAGVEDMKQSLTDFWDGEFPRIGEDNAKGWASSVESEALPDMPDAVLSEAVEPPRTRDVYKAWAAIEQSQARKSTLPGRTLDDGSDVDPFRVVIFTDIEELLFAIPTSVIPTVRMQLVDAFLLFCQLPPASCVSDLTEEAWLDPFVFTGSSPIAEAPRADSTTEITPETGRKEPDFASDGVRARITPDILFGQPHWFAYFGGAGSLARAETASVPITFSAAVIRQLARNFHVADLAEYSLALDYARDPPSIKKAARSLIKLYPSNVALYNAYAIAEHNNGNHEVAEKVLSSATSQRLGAGASDSLVLWLTWAWLDLDTAGKDAALGRLCASVDETPSPPSPADSGTRHAVTPSQLLKTRQKLSATRDHQLSTGNPEAAARAAQAVALLEYLGARDGGAGPASSPGAQGNISAALASVEAFSGELAARARHGQGAAAAAHERLLQFAARLLYRHARRGAFRPAYLREKLRGFVRLFPRNTVFLSLFAWAESGSAAAALRIDDPVREVLRGVALSGPHDCLSTRAFAIRHELRAGNAHSARAAFERALRSDALGHAGGGGGVPSLWRDYVRFCYGSRELRGRAKDVFYRAVHACPWSKQLVMEAFSTVVRDMDSSELRAVFNTITERGLRVHVELGEFVDKWKEEQRKGKRAETDELII
ncbi:uncharacterized protein E0L32_008974 [Thyridium curvatum]|uniref:Uncharacterized protein n=1 Tax=Thyridium curvatum TaxID=1093900 RepID=A0A507APT7_9PEZI|nr:uncharacterized protein E0L32_008974 [Thyridium curvatum]TPX09783.1 hypothetical protein E0L32_008974 [Thyridium curvatum]